LRRRLKAPCGPPVNGRTWECGSCCGASPAFVPELFEVPRDRRAGSLVDADLAPIPAAAPVLSPDRAGLFKRFAWLTRGAAQERVEPGAVVGREAAGVVGIAQWPAAAVGQEGAAGMAADAAQEALAQDPARPDRLGTIAVDPLEVIEEMIVVLPETLRAREPLIERRRARAQLGDLALPPGHGPDEGPGDVAVGALQLVAQELGIAALAQLWRPPPLPPRASGASRASPAIRSGGRSRTAGAGGRGPARAPGT
jgi:hypothetical protein